MPAAARLPHRDHIRSKQRVADHGEVFTRPREVKAMLDLVRHETERIDSRFLEPACGTGNFLAEVLRRKLAVVDRKFRRRPAARERNMVIAVSSLYGIDILEDNVHHCRERLFDLIQQRQQTFFSRDACLRTIRYILDRNIAHGDALSLKTVGDNPQPIVFSQWTPINSHLIKRKDFTFEELLSFQGTKERPLFSDLGEEAFFPTPIKEYPPTHYLKLADVEDELQS